MSNEKHKSFLFNESQCNEIIGAILTTQDYIGDLKNSNEVWNSELQARINRLESILKQIITAPLVDLSETNGKSPNDLDNYTSGSINLHNISSFDVPRVQLKHRELPSNQ